MISKGNTHSDGGKLAAYLTTSKEDERGELWQLSGFEATDIKDAFRDVQIMAGATKCEQPFFHVQVRNREGEKLTRLQWEHTANRIGRILGLGNQPRAIASHIDEKTGEEHIHIAWSRIDENTMTAVPLPYFKLRLKTISRELELHFALEPVTNHREGKVKFAPTRAQDQQARRLGLDPKELQNTIRECWDRSDCGKSFEAALQLEGMTLAQGDERDFVVLDRARGTHVLSKRILDVTASKIRTRLSDLSRDDLPTVDIARAHIEQVQQEQPREKRQERQQPWDRERADRRGQKAVIDAPVEKEQVELQYVEPQEQTVAATWGRVEVGSRKKEDLRDEKQQEHKAAGRNNPSVTATKNLNPGQLKGEAARVWHICSQIDALANATSTGANYEDGFAHPGLTDTEVFAAALDQRGISFAVATGEEAARRGREAEFAKAIGRKLPRFREGEIVIVTEQRHEFRRKGEIIVPDRIQTLDQAFAEKFVERLGGRGKLSGIEDTLTISSLRAVERAEGREMARLSYATDIKGFSRTLGKDDLKKTALKTVSIAAGAVISVAKNLDTVGNAVASLFAPTLSPRQIHDGSKAKAIREAEGEQAIDFTRFTAEIAQARREEERERQRQRERGGRER